jgi:hypothetical protein
MRFHYVAQQVGQPVYTLGGASIRWQPLVCTLVGLAAPQLAIDCLVDSAADDTVLPLRVAHRLGIDLTAAPVGTARGVGGTAQTYRCAQVQLRLSDGVETCVWGAIVGFLDLPFRHGLLGQAGFFQFFDVTFLAASQEVVIVPSTTFPGTYQRP